MELTAELRKQFGKDTAALRAQGLIPAEMYGHGLENIHLTVPSNAFRKAYKAAGENTIVNVIVADKQYPALIYDVTHHPLTGDPTHVDLYRVRMDEKLETKVPIEFIGESPAVKNLGAVLVKIIKELPVEALPGSIPHHITVDIGTLSEIGQSVHVEQLTVPIDVKVLVAPRMVVVTVKAKMTEEEEAALAAKGAVETVKVEAEEKKEERAAAKEAEAPAGTEGKTSAPSKAPAVKAPEKK